MEKETQKRSDIFEEKYKSRGFASQRKYPNESLISFLASYYFHIPIKERRQLNILELGCGSGANLWMVAREGFNTYGIDCTPTSLHLCLEMLTNYETSATLVQGDIIHLPFQDCFFDIVFDVVTMQHLSYKQHQQCYNEIFRILRLGGRFFSYHLGENSISLKSTEKLIDHCTIANIEAGYPLANNGQTCFISANEVRKNLKYAGFDCFSVDKIMRSYSDQRMYVEYLSIAAEKGE